MLTTNFINNEKNVLLMFILYQQLTLCFSFQHQWGAQEIVFF